MQRKRIQIVFYSLLLSGCAGVGLSKPDAGPDVSLRKDTALARERGKAPSPAQGRTAAPDADDSAAAADTDSQDDVYFAASDTRINERGQAVLRRHALRLKENAQEVVTLVGYTDPLGSRSYNLALVEERLDSVVESLRALGVPRGQIRRISAGKTMVATAGCDTPACRQLLRRVELTYER